MAELHYVDVGSYMIPGRRALYMAECRVCGWRSRQYRDPERACDAADKHQASTSTPHKTPSEEAESS